MPRLTADIVLRAPSRINPLKQRELDLRGNKIPAIENLGACQDQFDAIDFSDNEVGKLENFPLLNRVRSLAFNNNHITKIALGLSESLPNIDTLILTNNRIVNLADLDPLSDLSTLRNLSIIDNVVSKKPNYRFYVISKLPDLRVLDFKKIKRKEREESEKLYGAPVRKQKGKKKTQKQVAKTFIPGEASDSSAPATTTTTTTTAAPNDRSLLEAQLVFKVAVQNAKTIDEVNRLERAINTGGNVTIEDDAEMNEVEVEQEKVETESS